MGSRRRRSISERTKVGLARVKAQGKELGRPRATLPMGKKRYKVSPALLCRELKTDRGY